ncbi:hypothetical protein V499_04127 [Pseudogymnoascus sp. VKM F-103]|uniref:Uncharacterized protein n=1 Tax=Pseudogymnoascus verrucosus TaxID=342668 RepID=A0A1B8GWH2_9PEZI|nr:uncharacterized protein VE01_01846 [Pseudogymnoascus verrucosus]KFY76042.1 hypothetical protein V499_04127 [Pseudogymnoascus sp. VKM F-103]OBU00202.1 hypothetical protein VE01_01846 [Pseudogymnoascus verrucosus]
MADVQLDAVPVAIPEPAIITEPTAILESSEPTTVEEPASVPEAIPEPIAVSAPVAISEPITITEPTISPPASSLTKSTPPAPPSVKTLQSWLPLYLTKTDRLLTHFSRIISTPSGTDATLLTLGYSSLAISSLLTRLTTPSEKHALTARRLAALYALCSDVRMFARLFGLFGMWQWGKSAILTPSADPVERHIVNAQVLVNTIYQVLENGAYLSSKGVLGWTAEKQGKAWMWSSRCWAAHTALEFVRLARERQVRKRKAVVGEKGEEAVKDLAWRREVWINAGYAPLTIHWSLEGGIISPLTVGLLGSFVGAVKMIRLWEATA